MNKVTIFFISVLTLNLVVSFFIQANILSSDILLTIPSFAEEYGWQKSSNSLLSDPVFQFEPWRHYAKLRILSGELPYLNSENSLGVPFIANQQSAVFYPLNFIYYITSSATALFLIFSLKYYLFFVFFYLYFRVLKITKPLSLFGAFSVCCVGFLTVWLQWPHTNVFILFPLLLYVTEKIRQGTKSKYLWNLSIAFAYFLVALAGHPETALHLFMLHLIYIVFRLKDVKKIFSVLLFAISGILAAGFIILPFLEYLFNSYVLVHRSGLESTVIPFPAIVAQFIPLIFGGPHMALYKPLWDSVNFQEIIGGYVGIALLITSMIAIFKIKKGSLSYFWISSLFISYLLAFGVFPFSLLNHLPLFGMSANHRLVGFGGISIVVLAVLYLSQLSSDKKATVVLRKILFPAVIFGSILTAALCLLAVPGGIFTAAYLQHLDFLKIHITVIIWSTLIFFVFLILFLKTKSNLYLFVCVIAIALQTLGFYYNYNTFTDQKNYYPETKLTSVLSDLPHGTYLEVGNPALTENLNLMYGLSSIEDYDAIEVRKFRETYDRLFSERNQWGNPDLVTQEALNYFGINYLISDYDLRFTKIDIQPKRSEVLDPLTNTTPLFIKLPDQDISAVRLLPATFNRVNNCNVNFEIIDINREVLHKVKKNCSEFYNNMYFAISLSTVGERRGLYLRISTDAESPDNAISFFGSAGEPYFAILSGINEELNLKLLESESAWIVFENLEAKSVITNGNISGLEFSPERIALQISNGKPEYLEVKRTNFPGWEAYVDGVPVKLDGGLFLAINVPQGEHFVEFIYNPRTFLFGVLISFFTIFGLMIYFLRTFKDDLNRSKYKEKIVRFQGASSKIGWTTHTSIICLSIVLAAVIYFALISFLNLRFTIPETTAINWYTLNSYPRQQDYFYFLTAFVFIFSASILFWFIFLWYKNKK